jgi:transposase InsO family protein
MPWQETCVMDEKVRFIAAVAAGTERMAEVCRQFGISRKTGYKWRRRYQAASVDGLKARSRARHTQAHQTPAAVEDLLVALKARHPTWGPKKLVARLHHQQAAGQVPTAVVVPAPSTVGEILGRHGLVRARPRAPRPAGRTQPLAAVQGANALWCADFKGPLRTGDGASCAPLTITDAHSRYLVRCQALGRTDTAVVQPLFEISFREFGLPQALRTDNGPPFASTGLGGLTPLSVWWLKLGIRLDRIDPGRPQQNGRHERMHRVLAEDACTPPAPTLRAQQRAFDRWRHVYNEERPHEALGMVTPASQYAPSSRTYPRRVPEVTYPDADVVRRVRGNGTIRWQGQELYVTLALIGEPVGLTWLSDGQWELAFGPLVLAVLDEPTGRLLPVCARPAPPPADLLPI